MSFIYFFLKSSSLLKCSNHILIITLCNQKWSNAVSDVWYYVAWQQKEYLYSESKRYSWNFLDTQLEWREKLNLTGHFVGKSDKGKTASHLPGKFVWRDGGTVCGWFSKRRNLLRATRDIKFGRGMIAQDQKGCNAKKNLFRTLFFVSIVIP